jgi:hypothetical protein
MAQLRLDIDFSLHLVDELLADTQAKPCSPLVVLLILLKPGKVDKQFFNSFFRDAFALVYDFDAELVV